MLQHMPSYADWVGTAGLALSGALAFRDVRVGHRDRPRIVVECVPEFDVSAHEVRVGIQVRNEGGRAVTVGKVGFEVPAGPVLQGHQETYGVSATVILGQGTNFAPRLPHRLESHDEVCWVWPASLTAGLIDAGSFRPFVDVGAWRPPRACRDLLRQRAKTSQPHARRYYMASGKWIGASLLEALRQALPDR